jgi:hypothetical protein
VAERDLPYEVPELRYVEVDPERLSRMRYDSSNWWGFETDIASCVRCGRYTYDQTRDHYVDPMFDGLFEEDVLEVVCDDCREQERTDRFRRDIENVIDERLDLSEEDRTSLKKVVELVVTEPDKVLALKDLGNKVRELEKQTGRLWTALAIEGGLLAVLIASVVAIALALAS